MNEGDDFERDLGNGMAVGVHEAMFNDRLTYGPLGGMTYDRGFCFPKGGAALVAALVWDGTGDPPGPWVKEVGTDRYGPGMEAIR